MLSVDIGEPFPGVQSWLSENTGILRTKSNLWVEYGGPTGGQVILESPVSPDEDWLQCDIGFRYDGI